MFPFVSVVAFAKQAHSDEIAYKDLTKAYRANGFEPPPRPVYIPDEPEPEVRNTGFGWGSLILAYLLGAS
jgi:hypothetical protein